MRRNFSQELLVVSSDPAAPAPELGLATLAPAPRPPAGPGLHGRAGSAGSDAAGPAGVGPPALLTKSENHVHPHVLQRQVRKILTVDKAGVLQYQELRKHDLALRLKVPVRDLRMLDPTLATSYPTSILVRDHALVLNVASVKAIITVDELLIFNPEAEIVEGLLNDVRGRLAQRAQEEGNGSLLHATGLEKTRAGH